MPTITLTLPPETESTLRRRASAAGQTLEVFLQSVAERESQAEVNLTRQLTDEEFEQELNALAAGLPPLPPLPDLFTREDIYYDHD